MPAIEATLLLSDAGTGQLRAILDAGAITARRTAAVSGVAIQHWAPTNVDKPLSVALVGAGVQGQSHLAMLGVVLPGSRVTIHDRDPELAARLAVAAQARWRVRVRCPRAAAPRMRSVARTWSSP